MREIVLDTETTGLDPAQGDRIVEIGAVELFNHMPTGRTYHQYINPERSMPKEAFDVHGLGDDFLRDKPVFRDVAQAFLDFIGDAQLVIHNAAFDMKFLNAELKAVNLPVLPASRGDRHAGDRASAVSGCSGLARCPVPQAWRRQLGPRKAWGLARFRNSGRGVSGADRWSAA